MNKIYLCLVTSLMLCSSVLAQKKPLDHTVYDAWKSFGDVAISDNAKFSTAVVNSQEGDSYTLVKNLQNGKELIVPRAYKFDVTPDEQFIVMQIRAPFLDTRQAKIKKVADEKMPKDSLVIVRLSDFTETKFPTVKDYKLGKDFSSYVAYRIDDTLKVDKKQAKAYDLVLRNLATGMEDSIKNVVEYAIDDKGTILTVNVKADSKDKTAKNQILVYTLSDLNNKVISEGQTIYKGLTISESGDNIAFLASSDSLKQEIKEYKLYTYSPKSGQGEAVVLVENSTSNMPEDWTVSEFSNLKFSKNDKRLLLGTAPIGIPKDTLTPEFEKAGLDIWHWQDLETQPQQLVNLNAKLKENFLGYVDLATGKYYQLATETIPLVTIPNEEEGRYAIGISNLPYKVASQWDPLALTSKDIWVFDLDNNTSKQIKKGATIIQNISPLGNYMAWYDMVDRKYYAYDLNTDKEVCLTDGLDINFWNEKHDTPSNPNPYGVAAWLENDDAILVYDAFDIWKLDPTGYNKPENITKGEGRKNTVRLRYNKTNPDSRFIGKKDEILLTAFNEDTKEAGYYKLKNNKLTPLIMDKYSYPIVKKAKNKNTYAFVKGNVENSIDLYTTANDWKTEQKISDINPQMKDYNWLTAELVTWTTYDGKEARGLLYKPADFDPTKKYPMISYFYERHTDQLYTYLPPTTSRSIINIPYYCSNGYLVFTPDIIYTEGHPGESAYNYIVSGSEELAKQPWVDADHLGIQGQSWGGYQVAYLITRTNMFKAAGAGAPVSNMFSAYGGIRWSTGNSRQYQYEHGQSRIGGTIWDVPDLYVENSPLFGLPKVETPLLIMHNDADGAVPWYQGIELFMGLRRLHKPVWLLQYNGENHNLLQRRNTKDLVIRWQQFFDHYLKGAPMPVWMEKGIPATRKGQDYGFELVE